MAKHTLPPLSYASLRLLWRHSALCLTAAWLVATRRVTSAPARRPVVLLLLALPLLAPLGGAQRVVPVRRPGRWPLTHDSLGARVRLLYPHLQSP